MTLRLRLYVAGQAPNSLAARDNLRALLERAGHDGAEVEIVDVLEEPERGAGDGILVTPTLLRLAPEPARKIIGNLSDAEGALRALGLEAKAS